MKAALGASFSTSGSCFFALFSLGGARWEKRALLMPDFANPTPALQFIFALANWSLALQILIEIYARAHAFSLPPPPALVGFDCCGKDQESLLR